MTLYFTLRLLAFARRGVRALESISSSLTTLARLQESEWAAKHAPRAPRTKVSLGYFDVDEANKRYRARREAEGITDEDPR